MWFTIMKARQDNDSGDQASDGLVGHDIPSVSPRVNDDRARLSWNRQLDPATGCRAWQKKGSFQSPLAGRVGLPDEFGEVRYSLDALTVPRQIRNSCGFDHAVVVLACPLSASISENFSDLLNRCGGR